MLVMSDDILLSQPMGEVLLACGRLSLEMLLNALQCAGGLPPARVVGSSAEVQTPCLEPCQCWPRPGELTAGTLVADSRAGTSRGAWAYHQGGGELGCWWGMEPGAGLEASLCLRPLEAAAAGNPGAAGVGRAV